MRLVLGLHSLTWVYLQLQSVQSACLFFKNLGRECEVQLYMKFQRVVQHRTVIFVRLVSVVQ